MLQPAAQRCLLFHCRRVLGAGSALLSYLCGRMLGCFSRVQLFMTLWTIAHQALLSVGFSRQEHWSGLPCPSLGDPPDSGIKPMFLMSPALAPVHGVAKSWARLSNFTFTHWRRKWQPTPVFLPGESQGRGSLVGCRLWGRTESDTTEAT